MRFRVRYCPGCQRHVLIEDNKHSCHPATTEAQQLPPEKRFEEPTRLTRIYYSLDEMQRDYEHMQEAMPCPVCGTMMPDTGDHCKVPLIQVQGRFE